MSTEEMLALTRAFVPVPASGTSASSSSVPAEGEDGTQAGEEDPSDPEESSSDDGDGSQSLGQRLQVLRKKIAAPKAVPVRKPQKAPAVEAATNY